MNEDDELIVDEVNAEKKYKLTPFSQLKKLENCIREHQISGIDRITKVLHTHVEKPFYLNKEKGKFLRKSNIYKKGKWKIIEKTLETEGTNLIEILRLENIDTRRTVTDDVYEISMVLGIEAAR